MDQSMGAIVADLGAQHAELAGLLSDLDDAGWRCPTPCEGWTVADVVLHLAQTDELAAASVAGAFGEAAEQLAGGLGPGASVDEGVAQMVARERGEAGEAVRRRWSEASGAIERALAGCDPHARVVWVAGELSARTMAATRLAECWIHTTDVAAALGRPLTPTDRLRPIVRLAWRTLPYAFSSAGRELAGPVAFQLTAPDGRRWDLHPELDACTVVSGDALELCLVAGRRADPAATSLRAEGPDGAAVLELVRTYA